MGRKAKKRHIFLRVVFWAYCAVMLYLLFGRTWRYRPGIPYWEQVLANRSITPFYTIRNFLYVLLNNPNHPLFFEIYANMLGNVLLFVPAGLLLPKLYKGFRPYFRFLVKAVCIICLIEVLQLFTLLGVFDVDDIILNVLGMSFGYFLYFLFLRK